MKLHRRVNKRIKYNRTIIYVFPAVFIGIMLVIGERRSNVQ